MTTTQTAVTQLQASVLRAIYEDDAEIVSANLRTVRALLRLGLWDFAFKRKCGRALTSEGLSVLFGPGVPDERAGGR